jgi:hypothetical protein
LQEHVKLEIALEVLMNNIANVIRQLSLATTDEEKNNLETKLEYLMTLKERGYQGEQDAIKEILNMKEERKNNGK